MSNYKLSPELLQELVAYLESKPFSQVKELLPELKLANGELAQVLFNKLDNFLGWMPYKEVSVIVGKIQAHYTEWAKTVAPQPAPGPSNEEVKA